MSYNTIVYIFYSNSHITNYLGGWMKFPRIMEHEFFSGILSYFLGTIYAPTPTQLLEYK